MGSHTTSATPDQRSDQDILAELLIFKPVDPNSERNIWAFWDHGLAACKPWCQRNVISWVRRHSNSWTVRVVDRVPGSPNHYSKYISDTEFFPDSFLKRHMTGPYMAAHTADLIRLPLLYLHGGVWLDVGFMLFRGLDDLCWNKLADESNLLEMAGFRLTITEEIAMYWNGFIAARKGCVGIKYWHDIFRKVWAGRTSTEGMSKHPLLWHLPRYEVPPALGQKPAFTYATYVDYLIHMFCLERLRHIQDPRIGWDGPAYFSRSILLYECVTEVYWAQSLTQWDGRKQFELLNRQREGTERDEKYKEADGFVNAILDTSSATKFSHGIVTEQREYLARIWDQPENKDADIAPRTFAAHLRWASENFLQQNRELKPLLFHLREEALLTGGILDVIGTPHPHWENESG